MKIKFSVAVLALVLVFPALADDYVDISDATVRRVENDQFSAFIFTNTAATATFMPKVRAFVRELLVVGGGGSGGNFVGGGGGAGGVTNVSYGSNFTLLSAGSTVSITIGKGGARKLGSGRGYNGGNTTLTLNGETFVAYGGGAGGGWMAGAQQGNGGGCGGGSCSSSDCINSVGSQGGDGVAGTWGCPNGYCGGGGGGAGGDGLSYHPTEKRPGCGGIGYLSSITGTATYYAGGGGGGCGNGGLGGYGGLGGGGDGSSTLSGAITNAQCGVDGLGGGGGAAGGNDSTVGSGAGGCGTVILLVKFDDGTPLEDAVTDIVFRERQTLEVGGVLTYSGSEDATAEVYVQLYSGVSAEPGSEIGTEQLAASGLTTGASWSCKFRGLSYDSTYSYRVRIVNTLAKTRVRTATVSTTLVEISDATVRKLTNGQHYAYVFTNTATTITFTPNMDMLVREILVVGGGASGGNFVGGGGGAGGVTNVSYGANPRLLSAGSTVSIAIGKGGARKLGSGRGYNGGDTTLTLNGETFVAYGGGAGGGWMAGAQQGNDGGCGGGSCSSSDCINSVGSQGGDGVAGTWGCPNGYCGGGGGGAGGDGLSYHPTEKRPGCGGIGYLSSITGTATYYAGGGGGGCASGGLGGYGGLGGGGDGSSTLSGAITNAQCGVDGLGGGGGGTGDNDSTVGSGAGGCGTVILLVKADDGQPIEDAAEEIVWREHATLQVGGNLYYAGKAEATAEVYVQLYAGASATPGTEIGSEQLAASGLTTGSDWTWKFRNIEDLTTYSYRVRIVNSLSETFTRTSSVSVKVQSLASSTDASMTVVTNGESYAFVYTNGAAGTVTMTLNRDVYFRRALVVGGGGSGGVFVGGGGGAGGVTNLWPEAPVLMPSGTTLTLTVGAGGKATSTSGSGYSGKNSTLTIGDETYIAYGGGYGGGYGSGGETTYGDQQYGGQGGCGGGSGSHSKSDDVVGATGWQGGNGGVGYSKYDINNRYNSAGGGGAGGDGMNNGVLGFKAPAGGVGIMSDITGQEKWYAGGGGSGAYSLRIGGDGGKGGGGSGQGSEGPVGYTAFAQSGTDGTGGGGGGTSDGGINCGAGGSGTVILLLSPADGAPIEQPLATTAGISHGSVSGRISLPGYGAKTVSVYVALKTGEGEFGEEVLAASQLTVSNRWCKSFASLEPETTYTVRIRVVNDLGFAITRLATFTTEAADDGSATIAGGVESFVGPDKVCVFTNTASAATLTVVGSPSVRAIVVGGGGAGGFTIGGGGGAGGYIETNDWLLSEGDYVCSVGTGGLPRTRQESYPGGNGGDTIVQDPSGAEVFRAFGGGGGAGWDLTVGASGASGGGGSGTSTSTTPASGIAGQGNAGGGSYSSFPGGGGGAGAAGSSPWYDQYKTSGHGGVGRSSDITGTLCWYAGGGGGGGDLNKSAAHVALGGSGVGGNGAPAGQYVRGDPGVDGTGSGGGGGGWTGSGTAGGKGGTGAFIVRLRDTTHAVAPTLAYVDCEPDAKFNEAKVFWNVTWPGAGQDGAKVIAEFGREPGVYTRRYVLSNASAGLDSAVLKKLYPETLNYVRLVAFNGATRVATEEFTITAGIKREALMLILR